MAKPELTPGPFAIAGALHMALDYGNVERAVYGRGKYYPPTRDGTLAGLKDLIENRNRQLKSSPRRSRSCARTSTSTSPLRVWRWPTVRLLRERDAFVAARDYA